MTCGNSKLPLKQHQLPPTNKQKLTIRSDHNPILSPSENNQSVAGLQVACPPLVPPRHGYLECTRNVVDAGGRRRRVTNHAGTTCLLKCPLGYRAVGAYLKMCGRDGNWTGAENGTCASEWVVSQWQEQRVNSLGHCRVPRGQPRLSGECAARAEGQRDGQHSVSRAAADDDERRPAGHCTAMEDNSNIAISGQAGTGGWNGLWSPQRCG